MREPAKAIFTKQAHQGQVYAIDFNRFSQNLILTGG